MMLPDRSTSETPRRIYDPSLVTSFLAVGERRFSPGRLTAAAVLTPSAPARRGHRPARRPVERRRVLPIRQAGTQRAATLRAP